MKIYGFGIMISIWCLSDDVDLKLMAMRIKLKYDKYWANIDNVNIMLFIAMILDPRCKLDYVNWMIDQTYDVDKATSLKSKLNSVFISMFEAYNTSQKQPNDSRVQSKNISLVNDDGCASTYLNSMDKRQKLSQGNTGTKSECEKYLGDECEDCNDNSFEILSWWKENSTKYIVLSIMDRDVLVMPVSTVASNPLLALEGEYLIILEVL